MAAPGARGRRGWRDPDDRGAAEPLAPGRTDTAPAVLRPARGRRDDRLPHRGARPISCKGIDVPLDRPGAEDARANGARAFRRYACKMATGTGKTTVMGMLAAWSILNKVNGPGRRALLGRGAGGLPQRHDPQPPGRAEAAGGRSEPVPHARSRPLPPHAAARAGACAGHQLARVRAEDRPGRGPVGEGPPRRTRGPHAGDHPHRFAGRRRCAEPAT